MIRIIEREPTKLSGLSSLYITFDYKREIIDIIKTLDKYIYNPKTYTWEVPITNLAYLLDEFVYWDDISLQLKKEDSNKVHYYPKCQDQYKSKPFDHQMEAIEYALNVNNWLLLDDPGLGKTLQVIYSALELKEQKGLKHCLIICGINSLKATWESEIKKHSNLSCRILAKKINKRGKVVYGGIKERAEELLNPIDEFFIITNIESIRSEEVLNALKKNVNQIDMCVLDEAHKCLSGNTLIDTDDGYISIRDIVDNRLKCKIKSFNTELNKIEYKEIDSYYKSEEKENLIELTIQKDDGKEVLIRCTPDHPIYTKNRGYVQADYIKPTDILILD